MIILHLFIKLVQFDNENNWSKLFHGDGVSSWPQVTAVRRGQGSGVTAGSYRVLHTKPNSLFESSNKVCFLQTTSRWDVYEAWRKLQRIWPQNSWQSGGALVWRTGAQQKTRRVECVDVYLHLLSVYWIKNTPSDYIDVHVIYK